MSKTKNNPPTVLPDDVDSLVAAFYLSDGIPRVQFSFPAQNKTFDHAISEYSSLTPAEKLNLRAMLLALRNETYTLEGYV